jgi:hypothetical protein
VVVELGAGFAGLRESAHIHLRADGLLGMGPVWNMVRTSYGASQLAHRPQTAMQQLRIRRLGFGRGQCRIRKWAVKLHLRTIRLQSRGVKQFIRQSQS